MILSTLNTGSRSSTVIADPVPLNAATRSPRPINSQTQWDHDPVAARRPLSSSGAEADSDPGAGRGRESGFASSNVEAADAGPPMTVEVCGGAAGTVVGHG